MNEPLTVGGVFDGVGLLAYGLHRAGLRHAWLCEVDPWRRTILERRFPGIPVYPDIRELGAANAVRVGVVAGGFPCKGASTAGKREGFGHPETVLWREMFRVVRELRPKYVVIENVANILSLSGGAVWSEVLGDLASLGFDVVWDVFPAAAFGAPHLRERVIAVATDTAQPGQERPRPGRDGRRGPADDRRRDKAPADAARDAEGGSEAPARSERERVGARAGVPVEWGVYEPAIRRWEAVHGPAPEPLVPRVDARSSARVERSRLSALGDGVQVQIGELVGRHIVELEEQRVRLVA